MLVIRRPLAISTPARGRRATSTRRLRSGIRVIRVIRVIRGQHSASLCLLGGESSCSECRRALLAGRRASAGGITGSLERLNELARVPFGHLLAVREPIRCRPAAFWQMERAEQPVEDWQVHREVLVDGFRFRPVVPVVELRRRHNPGERSEPEADVGVDEGRLNADEGDIREERCLSEPEDSDLSARTSIRA